MTSNKAKRAKAERRRKREARERSKGTPHLDTLPAETRERWRVYGAMVGWSEAELEEFLSMNSKTVMGMMHLMVANQRSIASELRMQFECPPEFCAAFGNSEEGDDPQDVLGFELVFRKVRREMVDVVRKPEGES